MAAMNSEARKRMQAAREDSDMNDTSGHHATTPRYHDVDSGEPVAYPYYPTAGSSAWWRRVVKHEDPAFAEYKRLKQKALNDGRASVYVLWVDMYDYWADISCLEAGVVTDG